MFHPAAAILVAADATDISQVIWLVVVIFVIVAALVFLGVFARYFRLWIQSATTGAGIGIFDLLRMTFRKVNPAVIVRSKIMAVQAGMVDDAGITTKGLEAHYLAGGNVPLVIRAMIAAHKAKTIELGFKQATAIDLAGRNVLEAVQTSVYPKVIDCPLRGSTRPSLDAIAKNGIQLKVKARVTVRANLDQLIGGATEETIVARVGEGIVSAIGSADTHNDVLENPDRISRPCWPGGSIRRRHSRSCRSTSPISTWATTSAPGCRPTRPKPICAWPGPRPKGGGRWPWRAGAGERRDDRREAGPTGRGRGGSSAGHGRCVSRGPARDHGLLQAPQRPGRHGHAAVDLSGRHPVPANSARRDAD